MGYLIREIFKRRGRIIFLSFIFLLGTGKALGEESFPKKEKEIKLSSSSGQGEKLRGQEIAQRVYDREDGKDSYTIVDMHLIDSRNNERKRTVIIQVKDFGKLTKTMIRFTEPADIEGTGLLTVEKEKEDDDQFLYLPELKRVRRIISGKKDGRFTNTDFTYEDLERRKVEKDEHRLLREEELGGKKCYVLESIPKKESGSQYAKLIAWVVKDISIPLRIEYYGKRMKLEKIFTARQIQKVEGIWTTIESEISDLKSKHRTIMQVKKVRYNRGIPDNVFTERNLEKY
jgi:outer membrane lipoprotein-sorting protein